MKEPLCDPSHLANQFRNYSAAVDTRGSESASQNIRDLFASFRSGKGKCFIPELVMPDGVDEKTRVDLGEATMQLQLGSGLDVFRAANRLVGLLYGKDEKTRQFAAEVLYEYALSSAIRKARGQSVVELGPVTQAKAASLLPENIRKAYFNSFATEVPGENQALRAKYSSIEELLRI